MAPQTLSSVVDTISRLYTPEDLEELVDEAASQMATYINNASMHEQILFLLDNDWTQEEIINAVEKKKG